MHPIPPLGELRAVADADAASLIELVAAAYAEYPGCVMDLPGVDADLNAPATAAAVRGGRWWVLTSGEHVIASVGTGPLRDDGHVELKRLYLDRAARGQGVASALVARVEAQATGLGAVAVDLWSDSRFDDAHHRYRRLGYEATGEDRDLHDPSHTTEHRFVKALQPPGPRRRVAWCGPHGRDRCELTRLPDGTLLRGVVGGSGYEVELDGSWRTRRAELLTPAGRMHLTSDGAGRWWRETKPVTELTGCLDVDLEVTPATNLLPIRRLSLPVGEDALTSSAWIREDAAAFGPLVQHYTRIASTTWRYVSQSPEATFEATIEVDGEGLPVTYTTVAGDELWTRVR